MRKLISIMGAFLATAVVLPMLITLTYGGAAKYNNADTGETEEVTDIAPEREFMDRSLAPGELENAPGRQLPEQVYDYSEDADRYYGAETEINPTTTDTELTEPAATEPVTTEPVATEPVTTEPVATEPVTTEPVTTEPVTTEPEIDADYIGCDRQIVTVYIRSEDRYEKMAIGDYLVGVVMAEMPLRYDDDALKAQAVASRTFTLYRAEQSQSSGITSYHGDEYADICTFSGHCQAYLPYERAIKSWNDEKYTDEAYARVKKAVTDTSGIVVTYDGEIIEAIYHACSYQKTDSLLNVWGGSSKPYLIGVVTPEEADTFNVASKEYFKVSQMKKYVQNINSRATFTDDPAEWIEGYTLNENGRIESYKIGGVELSGTAIRAEFGLSATYFRIIYDEETQRFVFSVFGWGHGVGMSQYGAGIYADKGYDYEFILKHYYTGTELEQR